MEVRRLLSLCAVVPMFTAVACSAEMENDTETSAVATETSAIFTGTRVPGLVMGLLHNENQGKPGVVMFTAFASEADKREGGDSGAANHRGFEWWSLRDTGGDPAALKLPPGVVVALKHSAVQASVNITAFGRNPVNGADFTGFKRQNGGDLGASNGVGYYWYESTGAGFTNWAGVDAMLPKYTVVGLKHASNQASKVLVWNGVTYDAAAAGGAVPPGFKRMVGGDAKAAPGKGYWWFEKQTGEEIVTQTAPTVALGTNLRMVAGTQPSRDKDGDLLDDAMEAVLASAIRPHVTFDSDEIARRSANPVEPVTVWRMYPTSNTTVHVRWLFLLQRDGGYGPEANCLEDSHSGDNDHADYDLVTPDAGYTWRVTRVSTSNPARVTWPATMRLELFDKTHPKFYFSASKHHVYMNRDNDESSSFYSAYDCDDDVNGAGAKVLVSEKSFDAYPSNNVGEPESHAGFVDSLEQHFPGYRIWPDANGDGGCFVNDTYIYKKDLCITNASKFTASDLPPKIKSFAVRAQGYLWSGFELGLSPVPAAWSYNSTGLPNRVVKTGTGKYQAIFPGLGDVYGGNVQVTAYGEGSERCKVVSFGPSLASIVANVACFTAAGTPIDTLFTASFFRKMGTDAGSPSGYLLANDPYSASYTPDPTYQYNSSGALNTVERYDTGLYIAHFPGIAVYGGTVEVTAHGPGNASCRSWGWGTDAAWVACSAPTGEAVDSAFTLNFARLSPQDSLGWAYVWANDPYSENYTPSNDYQSTYRYCRFTDPITIRRLWTGRYQVTISTLSPVGSTVHVTAYGGSSEACKVESWGSSVTGGTLINVLCHTGTGEPADSYFVLNYTSMDNGCAGAP